MKTRDRYKAVNALWPAKLPALEPAEAMRAAKALLRKELGNGYCRQYRWKIAPKRNARTYPRSGTWYVAPAQGWHDLVHDLSHYVHRRRSRAWFHNHGRRLRPHHWLHANIEARMIRTVLKRGWLGSEQRERLLPKPTSAPLPEGEVARRLQKVGQDHEEIQHVVALPGVEKMAVLARAPLGPDGRICGPVTFTKPCAFKFKDPDCTDFGSALDNARKWCAPRLEKLKRRLSQAAALERRIKHLTTLFRKRSRSVAGLTRSLAKSDHWKLLCVSGEVEELKS